MTNAARFIASGPVARRRFCLRLLAAAALFAGWCAPAALAAQPTAPAPAPLLGDGRSADWLFVYKFNAASFPTAHPTSCRFGGTPAPGKASLAFAAAHQGAPALADGAGLAGTTLTDPLGATFNQIYSSGLNFIVWNDQFYGDPRLKCGANCTGRWGHSKGILAWDDSGNGLILQVTTPAGSTDYTIDSFKWAFSIQYVLWAIGIVQTLRYRRRTIRALAERDPEAYARLRRGVHLAPPT